MAAPPRVACINDLSGYGRCSLTTAIAVLSAIGVQACPMPTAILSRHTGFPDFTFADFTPHLQAYAENWADLSFDGIYTGFLGSEAQIGIVEHFLQHHRQQQNAPPRVLIDTVMGDGGKIYPTYTPALCALMRRLVSLADVITPNVTEACILTGTPYRGEALRTEEAKELAKRLAALGCGAVVITGIERGDLLCNLVLDRDGLYFDTEHRTERCFSGTGDLFASVVSAALVQGIALPEAVSGAGKFIAEVTAHTLAEQAPVMEGVRFEPCLPRLAAILQERKESL